MTKFRDPGVFLYHETSLYWQSRSVSRNATEVEEGTCTVSVARTLLKKNITILQ